MSNSVTLCKTKPFRKSVSGCNRNDRLMFNCIIEVNSIFHAYFFPLYESPPNLIQPRVAFSSFLTYLLIPWCRVLLEKLTGLQLVKKFPTFHGTRRFITALTSARHLSLSWTSPIQSIYPHPTIWRPVLISTHLRLDLPCNKTLARNEAPWWWSDKIETCRSVLKCFKSVYVKLYVHSLVDKLKWLRKCTVLQ